MTSWKTNINDLMHAFNEALKALVPIAQKVHMHWKEPDNYDDWDEICTAIYNSIVVKSVEHSKEGEGAYPLAAYDLKLDNYNKVSHLSNVNSQGKDVFIGFETKSSPFDTCCFGKLDNEGKISSLYRSGLSAERFIFVTRNSQGASLNDTLNVTL